VLNNYKIGDIKLGENIIGWDKEDNPIVPDNPIIPYIEGDGIGPDIWAAAQPVFDRAVEIAYEGKRQIIWHEL